MAAGVWLSFQPSYCCVYRISLFFHFPLRILFRSLLHYVALTKRRDFPDKTVPHSPCLCASIPILTFLCKALKGHYLVSTMKYDCVCLLLIMATIGACSDDKICAVSSYAAGIQPPPRYPFKKNKIPHNKYTASSVDRFGSCLLHLQFTQKEVSIPFPFITPAYFIISSKIDPSRVSQLISTNLHVQAYTQMSCSGCCHCLSPVGKHSLKIHLNLTQDL